MTKEKLAVGRPKIEIDFAEMEKLCAYQASREEIAAWFNISTDTLETRVKDEYGVIFSEFFARFKGVGKLSLRRKQFQEAMKGNTTLLVHLGKNHLDQFDRQKVESDNTNKNVELSYEEYLKTLDAPNSSEFPNG